MKKYTKKQASKLIIIGGVGYGLSALLSLVTLWRIYDKAGCQSNCGNIHLELEQTLSHIALWASYVSLAVAFTGVVLLIIAQKPKHKD